MDTKTEQDPVRNEPAHAEETTDGARNAPNTAHAVADPDGAKYEDDAMSKAES